MAVPLVGATEVEVVTVEVVIRVAKQKKSAVQIHFCISTVNKKMPIHHILQTALCYKVMWVYFLF